MIERPKINGLKQAELGRAGSVKVLDSDSQDPIYYTSLVLIAISICLEPLAWVKRLTEIDSVCR